MLKKTENQIVDIQINNQFDTCTNKLKLFCKATDRARPNDEQELQTNPISCLCLERNN